MSRPSVGDFGAFYQHYVALVSGNNAKELASLHAEMIVDFISKISEEMGDHAYDDGKWTIRQVLQHMLDTERIFVYRLIWIARGDARPLPGFDENLFAAAAPAHHRKMKDLVNEFIFLRKSTDLLIGSLTEKELVLKGEASGYPVTVNALCFIIYGHNLHHLRVLEERYLG